MFYTDDPLRDFERFDAEQEKKIEKLPICCICNEHIQDDTCYVINDEVFCEECHNSEFKKRTEDLIVG